MVLSRESPSEFRRYRHITGVAFLTLVIGAVGLLVASVAWALWAPRSARAGQGSENREASGGKQAALACVEELDALEVRLVNAFGELAKAAEPDAGRERWAGSRRDWDRDLKGVTERCHGEKVLVADTLARAIADLTAIAQAYDALAGELIAGPVPRIARWRAELGASRSAVLTGTTRRAP